MSEERIKFMGIERGWAEEAVEGYEDRKGIGVS